MQYKSYERAKEEYKIENYCSSHPHAGNQSFKKHIDAFSALSNRYAYCHPNSIDRKPLDYYIYTKGPKYILLYLQVHFTMSILYLSIDSIYLLWSLIFRSMNRTTTAAAAATTTTTATSLPPNLASLWVNHLKPFFFKYLLFHIGFCFYYDGYVWLITRRNYYWDFCDYPFGYTNIVNWYPFGYIFIDENGDIWYDVSSGEKFKNGQYQACTLYNRFNERRLDPYHIQLGIITYSVFSFLLYWIIFHKYHYYLLVQMGSNPNCCRKRRHMRKLLFLIRVIVVAHIPFALTLPGFYWNHYRRYYEDGDGYEQDDYQQQNHFKTLFFQLVNCFFGVKFFYSVLVYFGRSWNQMALMDTTPSSASTVNPSEESNDVGATGNNNDADPILSEQERVRRGGCVVLYVTTVSILSIVLFAQESYKQGIHFYYKEFQVSCDGIDDYYDIKHRLNDETVTSIIPLRYIVFVLWLKLFQIRLKPSYWFLGASWIVVLLLENLIVFCSNPIKDTNQVYALRHSKDTNQVYALRHSFTLFNFHLMLMVVCWNTLRQCVHATKQVTNVLFVMFQLLLYVNQIMYNESQRMCNHYVYGPGRKRYNWLIIGSFTLLLSVMNASTVYRKAMLLWYALRYRLIRRPSKDYLLLVCSENGCAVLQFILSKTDYARSFTTAATTDDFNKLYKDRDITIEACQQNGLALKYAHPIFRSDKEIVIIACLQHGWLLELVDPSLRMDKEVVVASVTSSPDSLKYALGGLNQDPECLVAAKLWDQEKYYPFEDCLTPRFGTDRTQKAKQIVMSTKFALSENSQSLATKFTVLLKQHPYIQENCFNIYSPNAYEKSTCDPQWTRKTWPCRGTYETCRKEPSLKVGVPTPDSCWRYSFRHQLKQAKESNGFMIQLCELHNENHLNKTENNIEDLLLTEVPLNSSVDNNSDMHEENDKTVELVPCNRTQNNDDADSDPESVSAGASSRTILPEDNAINIEVIGDEEYSLGKGQSIETDMGKDVGTKSFVVYQPTDCWLSDQIDLRHVDKVVMEIKAYYESQGCHETTAYVPRSTAEIYSKSSCCPHGTAAFLTCQTTGRGTQYDPRKDFFMIPND